MGLANADGRAQDVCAQLQVRQSYTRGEMTITIQRPGVAVILKKGIEKSLLEWKAINSRLMKIRLKGRQINTTIIQCYAPTNDNTEVAKDEFYEQLQAELNNIPGHDMRIIMGDMNAKVGMDNTGYDRTMGKHGCGTMNENGERLVEICSTNDFVIGGTLFPHKDIHKLTWQSPNGRDKNQIDHLMINGTWRHSLCDVRVMRGADVASDHHLVLAIVQVKLRKAGRKGKSRQQFDIAKLRDPKVKTSFVTQLRNRFQLLSDQGDTQQDTDIDKDEIDTRWEETKQVYLKTSETCLGFRKKDRKEWISDDTWRAIEARRGVKKQFLDAKSDRLKDRYKTQYQEANRDVKRKSRADKRAHMEDLGNQAEEAAAMGDQGKLYKLTKIISGKFRSTTDSPIEDKHGKLLSTEAEIEARWAEHFSEVLNRPQPTTEADIQNAEDDLDISTEPPSKAEIITAIKSLKNGKAPGQDNLNAEIFKADPDLAAGILQPLFADICRCFAENTK